ncbi:hypothetical protein GCK32_019945 [Trichostrongylus colubriformis]|uniref:Uncharacterized protein n=1 Tax=Trichostrongylus colubriformis TaxID=6319 RepID=A0AAN8EN93_TRICO
MGLIGFPLLYLEAALGQYVNASALTIFDRIAPICVGIGVSSTITLFLCCLIDHHRLVMVFVASFDSFNFFADKLPWAECLSMGNREVKSQFHVFNIGIEQEFSFRTNVVFDTA